MGARLETVKTDFDVYMIGKVLWCMVAGKPKLDREFWDEPENDLTKLFPSDPHMHMINLILGRSVVTREEKCCGSANDLLLQVDTNLEQIKQGGQLLLDGITRICHVCGVGRYARQALVKDTPGYNMRLWNSGGANDIATPVLKSGNATPVITFNSFARIRVPNDDGDVPKSGLRRLPEQFRPLHQHRLRWEDWMKNWAMCCCSHSSSSAITSLPERTTLMPGAV
jgi:hypothetical protein